jgi:hypothetical protein
VLLPPLAAFAGFRGLATLNLEYIIFFGEKAWEWLVAMISATTSTLEKLRLVNIAFHHVAPGGGLPVPWHVDHPRAQPLGLELCLTMAGAGSWELGHLPKLDYASIMLNAQEPRGCSLSFLASGNLRCLAPFKRAPFPNSSALLLDSLME